MLVACVFNLYDGTDPGGRHGKRAEASAMKLAKRSMDRGRAGVGAFALDSKNIDAAITQMECMITTVRRVPGRREWRHAIKSATARI
jgi:hypothetical protein